MRLFYPWTNLKPLIGSLIIFLFKTLQFAGFGPQFISLIEILYKSPTLKVIVNGQLLGEIPVKRGVRQ